MDSQDHDLLIELRTEMKALRIDVTDIKDNTNRRVSNLELYKLDIGTAKGWKEEEDKLHNDHEARVRTLEKAWDNFTGKYAVIGSLGVTAISAFVAWVMSKIN